LPTWKDRCRDLGRADGWVSVELILPETVQAARSVIDKNGPLEGNSTRIDVYKCDARRKAFTVKVGTVFE
jgi:hypothetical protein